RRAQSSREWGRFLSPANQLESARRGRNAPHSRIRADKNVCPTRLCAYPQLQLSRKGVQLPSRRRSAFTLLEVLCALTIVAVISFSLFASIRSTFKQREAAENALRPLRDSE